MNYLNSANYGSVVSPYIEYKDHGSVEILH
jgi:hypothetical protein